MSLFRECRTKYCSWKAYKQVYYIKWIRGYAYWCKLQKQKNIEHFYSPKVPRVSIDKVKKDKNCKVRILNMVCLRTRHRYIKSDNIKPQPRLIRVGYTELSAPFSLIINQIHQNKRSKMLLTYTLQVLFGNCWITPAAVRDIETFRTFPYWPKYSLCCRSCSKFRKHLKGDLRKWEMREGGRERERENTSSSARLRGNPTMYTRFRWITLTLLSCFLPSDGFVFALCDFFRSILISATNLSRKVQHNH